MHFKKPLLKQLQNLATPYYASTWKEIGLKLGIAEGVLQTIETSFQTDVERCTEMFTKWLETDASASWDQLIRVVYSPAVTEIMNTFNKSPYNRQESTTESGAVEELENKLKEQHIITRYRSSQDDWFTMPEHFTSVALIHQKRRKTKREIIAFANMHLKGDFTESGKITTDITESGKFTTYIAEIFESVEFNDNPYTLLIEGAPGIGKTILSKEIVFQWAKGKLLKKEKLVCLIYLRDPKVKTLDNFESFINYISYSQISKEIEQFVCKKSGKGVCFIFDGYDEYPEELRNSSFLSKLINHKLLELQLCNIVITSRPSASACLHNIVDLRVEILGFTKEHRKSYIMHALKDNPNAIQDLLEYLESSYSVDAYCHIPLSMAILVFLFKELEYDKNQLPTTQTEINYKFICITIRRFIIRSQQQPLSISKFTEVPATHRKILLEISKLAFTALKDDEIVFSASEIRHFCPSLLEESKHWNGLDLLKAVQYFSLEENKDELFFNFLHYSVQELLAAYHISLMSLTWQIKLLKETFWNSRYFNTWIMYVALTKDQPFAFKHFLSGNKLQIFTRFSIWWSGSTYAKVSKTMKEDKIKCLHLFQCFTEAGNDEMCHYVGNLLQDGIINLSGQALSAVNLYTLSLFLARGVRRQWKLLDFSNCYLDDENFERFYKSYASLTKSAVFINTVNLSSNAFTQASASQIANLVLNFNVQKLVFTSNEIQDIGVDQATFVALLEHPNFQSRFIEIQDENQVNLLLYKKGLNDSVVSELFIMYYCTVEAYKDIYLYIENNSSFFEKFINTNSASIFKTMLHMFVNKMTSFSTNLKLYVKTNNSTNEEINSIISSLASNVPLAVCIGENCLPLHLYNISNEIKDENKLFNDSGTTLFHGKLSIKATHSMFTECLGKHDLKQIYFIGITLCDSLMDNVLPKCTSLNTLQLVDCCIHDGTPPNAVANMLSQMLRNATFLEHLRLSGCRLKTEHMKIILEALTQAVSIVTIFLSDINLFYGVFDLLASVITCNRGLKCVEVSDCNLQEAAIASMTQSLENCEDLQSLNFSNNIITDDIAVSIAMLMEKCRSIQDLTLQRCQLHYAGIQKIAEAMAKKTCLRCINFSDNAISDQSAMFITSAIVNNTNIQKLKFSNCKLQTAGLQQLFQATTKITSLVHLDLSNNLFTDVTVDNFALMIHQNVSLEYLNISGCCVKAKDFEKITHSLVTLKSLTHLDLSCNVVNITSAENIAIIITNNTFLENLNLSNCEVRKTAFLKIFNALQNNQYLKHLYFISNSVGYEEATGIAMVFANNQFLENVDLCNCNLTEKEMKAILSSLRNHTTLKHFDISSCTITNHVVNDIVDVIDSNTQLTHLNISDSDIQEYGVLKIFKAIRRINTLKCIKMCNCTISDQAAKDIANALSVNCMVEELVFTNNDFHETGIALIFDVLKEAHTLKSLSIAYNSAISNVTTKLIEVVSNNDIACLDLSNCDLQESSCLSILNTLILRAPSLQHIDLNDTNLSGTAETIAQLISVSYYLQHVNLANTLMENEEVTIIIKAMQNINSLRYVDLTSYGINDELALELQNTVDRNPSIISFQLSRLCFKNDKPAVTTLGKTIFTVIHNLQQIIICFTDCENNKVDAVVTLINNSPGLQHLHLENCSMLEINFSNFIVALSRTTALDYFCLVNIVISDQVDDGIAAVIENNTQLKYFKVVACQVTQKGLTKCIQSLNVTQLSHLVLCNIDNLINHDTRKLNRPICDSLTHLNLSNVNLGATKLFFLSLSSLTKLQHLDLSHNSLTDESADILSSVIFNNNGLQHLDLCNCELRSEAIRIIAYSLQAINVVYLNMGLNTVDVDTFNNDLMPALFSTLNVIEHLCLPYCELKQREINKTLNFISNALHLKCIDFGPNMIPKNIISDFKNIVFVSRGNKHICFSTEAIKEVNIKTHETEKLYHSLYYLNINNITVDDEVENMVAALIDNSPELGHLEISGGKWTISGSMKCFRALQNNSHLIYINFSTDHDIQSIISGVKVTSSLMFLDLNLSDTEGIIEDQVAIWLANNKHLQELRLPTLVLDNNIFHQIQSRRLVIKELRRLTINNCVFTDEDTNTITSLIASNPTLHELTLLECEMSVKCKIKFTCIATALYLQCLKYDIITVTDVKHSPNTSIHCNKSNVTLINNDVVCVMTVDNNLGELIMLKLILNQNSLNVLSVNAVTIRYLKALYIQDCTFTDYYAHYVAFLITNNATTIQSFSLTSCRMSMKQKMIIAKTLYKLNIVLLQQLDIRDILYSNEEHKAIEGSCFNTRSYKLTDEIIIAAMIGNKSLRISKLLINQNTLVELRKSLFINQQTSSHDTGHLFHSLRYLNVKNITVDNEVENLVAALISNSPKLEHLELAGDGWTFTNTMKCFSAFQTTKYLIHFNLSNSTSTLGEILSLLTNFTALKCLHLRECVSKSKRIVPLTTLNIIKTLNSQTTLNGFESLDLSNNFIDDITVKFLGTLIATSIKIQYLNFYNCTLNLSAVQIIYNALKLLPSLKFLDIRINIVGGKVLHDNVVVAILINSKHLEQLKVFNLELDNSIFHQIKSYLPVIKGLEQLIFHECIFTDSDATRIMSFVNNNSTLHELCLFYCEMSVKCTIKFSCIASALEKKLGTIGIINKKNKCSLTTNTSIHCNVPLTYNDVVAVMNVDNNLGELIMFKLILNQNNLKVLSANNVMVRDLNLLQIKYCTFTDNYAYYVATLISNNLETIQCFSLKVCQMSIKQKMIITKALYKLDISALHHLNIRDIIYIDDETTASLDRIFANLKTNCKLTDDIIKAVMTNHVNLVIPKLVINESTLTELKGSLQLIKGVTHLTINFQNLHVETDANVASIITNNDCIQELVLSNCMFPQGYSETFQSLSFLQSLKLLSFDKVFCSEDMLLIITNNPGLRHFTMSNAYAVAKIVHCIAESLNNLLHLNFSDIYHSSEVVKYITTVITFNTKLKHINLCKCRLHSVDVKNIIQTAKSLTTLEYFNLSYNQRTDDLVNDITTLIANNKHIKVLSLPNYTLVINDNNCIKVVLSTVTNLLVNDITSLITKNNVTELNLFKCTLNNEQFKVVFNAVVTKSSLPCVHFTINEITDIFVTDHLEDAIENKSRIKKVLKLLIIQDNIIMDQDLVKISEIDHLSLVGCAFDFIEWYILKQLVFHNVTLNTLTLSDCKIYSGISEIVSICTDLKYLDLTNVNIIISESQIWPPIVQNNLLKTISINSINFNEQVTVDMLTILYNSKNLEHFAVVKCKIDGCGDTGVWRYYFACKKVFACRNVFACKNVLHLDLSYSKISAEMIDCILTHSNKLTHIKLIACNFGIFLNQICNRLRDLCDIVYLNMNDNKTLGVYASKIAAIIRHNENLRQIEMSGCKFDTNEIVEICESLCSCFQLQNINLSHNEIAGHAVDVLLVLILQSCLECINLQNCGLTSDSSKSVITALTRNHSLKLVDLSLNEMAEDSAVDIAALIANNKNIEVLRLPNCVTSAGSINEGNFLLPCYSLSHYMLSSISDSIKHARSIEFGFCQLNSDLASGVAALATSNNSLKQLKFSELVLTHNGLKQLGNSILIIEGLNNISITGVHLTDSDADNLATLINNNKSVKSFDISDCVISYEGKNIIFEAIINLTSLKSLNLKNIVISDTVEDNILFVIANNTNLEYLEVTGCEINITRLCEVTSSFVGLKVVSE